MTKHVTITLSAWASGIDDRHPVQLACLHGIMDTHTTEEIKW
jgi:hypothetical protein